MSRIGKKPVPVPAGVQADVAGRTVKVKGPKGELSFTLVEDVKVSKTAEGIEVAPVDEFAARTRHVGHVAHDDRQHDEGRHDWLCRNS